MRRSIADKATSLRVIRLLNVMDPSAVAVAVALFGILFIWSRRRNVKLPYPPGPKGLPLIGNLFDVPKQHEWLTYAKWSRDFGTFLFVHL